MRNALFEMECRQTPEPTDVPRGWSNLVCLSHTPHPANFQCDVVGGWVFADARPVLFLRQFPESVPSWFNDNERLS